MALASADTYDNNGNTLTSVAGSNTTTYTWDFENRLASATLPGTGGSVTFKYDPFGRRIQKSFTQSSTTTTTNYLYDGDNSIEEVDQNGAVLARYTQGLNIDEPLAELRSGTTSYYQADGLGSVTSLTNGAGALANTYTYDSFGKQTASTGTLTNPFRYTARELDAETNLYYYRARYYDPGAGRFTSEDSLREVVGGLNFYAYVLNNPARFIDPIGQGPFDGLPALVNRWSKGLDKAAGWSLCFIYALRCLDTGLDTKSSMTQAEGDASTRAANMPIEAQQAGANSESDYNRIRCLKGDPNCQKALDCAKKGITLPIPVPYWFKQFLNSSASGAGPAPATPQGLQ
jgi:RHS repeat-associated protein